MAKITKACVLRTAGTNCDKETAFAFLATGAQADLIHINALIRGAVSLDDYHILAIPGGFTYGDDLGAGKLLANELRYKLAEQLRKFAQDGKLIIGICNGFQVLVKSGLLPGNEDLEPEASLIINDSGKFEDRWIYLCRSKSKCIWTRGLPQIIYLPVAHGEGKFVTADGKVLARLKRNNQIVFQYCSQEGKLTGYPDNPNGSIENIAGICDASGRVLGLMPHPERHMDFLQHPRWTGCVKDKNKGQGLQLFKNGVEYARKKL